MCINTRTYFNLIITNGVECTIWNLSNEKYYETVTFTMVFTHSCSNKRKGIENVIRNQNANWKPIVNNIYVTTLPSFFFF